MSSEAQIDYRTFDAALAKSNLLEAELIKHPEKYRVLTETGPPAGFTSGISSVRFKIESACRSWVFPLSSLLQITRYLPTVIVMNKSQKT